MAQVPTSTGPQWGDVAEAYERMTAQTNRAPIGAMLQRANTIWSFAGAVGILDNGCGPGPVMARIVNDHGRIIPRQCELNCTDFSDGMVEWVRKRKEEYIAADPDTLWQRVECFNQNAMDLDQVRDECMSHVFAGWVFFIAEEPDRCLNEARRVLRDGGVLACSGWQHSQWDELMRLITKVRPDKDLPTMRKGWESADAMRASLERGGFLDVDAFEVPTTMEFEKIRPLVDFMVRKLPFMQPLTKDMSEEELERLSEMMVDAGKQMCPREPGQLCGTALIAVGRK